MSGKNARQILIEQRSVFVSEVLLRVKIGASQDFAVLADRHPVDFRQSRGDFFGNWFSAHFSPPIPFGRDWSLYFVRKLPATFNYKIPLDLKKHRILTRSEHTRTARGLLHHVTQPVPAYPLEKMHDIVKDRSRQ